MPQHDQLQDDGETFHYREGNWTSKTGLCVSTTRGAALTLMFYQHHGRGPSAPQVAAPKRAPSRVEREKANRVRAAIAKATATRASRQACASR